MHDTFLSFLLNLYPFSATKLFHVAVVLFSRHLDGSQVNTTKLLDRPWKKFGIDLTGPFTNNEYLLVVIDYYSRFPEVEIVRSSTSATIVLSV
jgi:hypothetical protein